MYLSSINFVFWRKFNACILAHFLLIMFHSPEVVFLFKDTPETHCATETFLAKYEAHPHKFVIERIFAYDYQHI